jgi:RhtB (resistance to homoserine/threonine) family protein
MFSQLFSIGFLILLSAMLPGPDFAMVTKNTIAHSRRAGFFTSLGIGCAVLVHMSYCLLGLAIVISRSLLLFNLVKYVGAAYLIYLGVSALRSGKTVRVGGDVGLGRQDIPVLLALRQGFFCNLLNPKATLFFLALFTVVIKPETPLVWQFGIAAEIFVIVILWFCGLTLLLSHPTVARGLEKAERYISKVLGVFLVGFGVALAFVNKS